MIVAEQGRKFCQLLHWSSGTRLRQRAAPVYITRLGRSRHGDVGDVHSLGDCTSDQSRISTSSSSRRDWCDHWQTKTTDLGRPIKVI